MQNKSIVLGVSVTIGIAAVCLGFLQYRREIIFVFKTWSLVSTAATTVVVLAYFTVTGIYNWHRQYRQSRQEQQEQQISIEQQQQESEVDWNVDSRKGISTPSGINATDDPKRLLEQLKVFYYLEPELLEQMVRHARIAKLAAGQELMLGRREMAFVGIGKFMVTFKGESASTLQVPVGPGGTLCSYANAIRALASAYFVRKSLDTSKGNRVSIRSIEDDSTAIILTEASFKQLVQCSDLAVAHLTQIMLTRFKRATLPILLNYFQLESVMTAFLPYFLYRPSGMNSAKFSEVLDSFQVKLACVVVAGL